jgi:hypothetical protein
MKPAKDRFGSDGIRLSVAMARSGNREDEGTDRRIGNTGTQRHVWRSAVVTTGMGFAVVARVTDTNWTACAAG